MGKWTGDTPQHIWLFERVGDELWIPFGCLQKIWRLYPVKHAYSVQICPIKRIEYQSRINLYDYQEKAVNEAIWGKNGVLVMPCGAKMP